LQRQKKLRFWHFRFQLRGAQILDAVRLHKNGFPESMTYADFWRRYRILSDPEAQPQAHLGANEVKLAVEELLAFLDLDKTAARLGNSQVRAAAFSETPFVLYFKKNVF
jgi:myosin-18